jgi:uncharacterized protein with FMN-binding domain
MIPKRALGALLTTVFALAMLFSFKPATNLALSGTTSGGTVAVGAAPGASSTTGSSAASADSSAPTTAEASPTAAVGTQSTTANYKDGTATGSVISTRYGDLQVEVTISGGVIVDVTALQLPDRDGRSRSIASQAEPILREEALTAQSANIDLLSGATYTSDAYAQSLQSALDQVQA